MAHRRTYERSAESDDWFVTSDFVNRIVIIGFDRAVFIDPDDQSRFDETFQDAVELLGPDFDVVFWCGPSAVLPSPIDLIGFDLLVAKACCAGARQFGLMLSDTSRVDPAILRRRVRELGHELIHGDTVDTLEFSFGIARMNKLENPAEKTCDCAALLARISPKAAEREMVAAGSLR